MTNELLPVEWNGRTIRRREDGYFSATDMCQSNGKLFADWARLDSTKEFMGELSETMGIPIIELVQSLTGVGTWVHPEVATALAMWLSPKFHVFVVGLVRKWAEGKLVLAPVEEDTDLLIYRGFQEAMKRLGEYEPKARAYDRIAASEGSQNLTETAKILRIPRNILINKLHRMHWIYRRPGGENSDWVGYDYHTKNGDLEHVFHEIIRSGIRMQICQVRVTARGIAKLSKIFTNKTDDSDGSGSPPSQRSLNLSLGVAK